MHEPANRPVNEPPGLAPKFPAGIRYIIGNEAAERFSFYGMRSILQVYLTDLYLGFVPREASSPEAVDAAATGATAVLHLFKAGVYATPMIGAILADRLLGKYNVIFWVSLVYCLGHLVLSVACREEWGMYLGLTLIAVASGGIKPCVSANVGDQFDKTNASLVTKVYQVFYFSINFGSFFATLLIPYLLGRFGPDIAFGVPGVLMGIATVVFWLGRHRFVRLPPQPGGRLGALDFGASLLLYVPFVAFAFLPAGGLGLSPAASLAAKAAIAAAALIAWAVLFRRRRAIQRDHGFFSVLHSALSHRRRRPAGTGFLDGAREELGDEAVDGARAVLRIMLVFSMVSCFWALFDQHSSTWIRQAESLDRTFVFLHSFRPLQLTLAPSQIAALNPLFVMLIIPASSLLVFRPLERRGIHVKPLVKMAIGMFLTALSFVTVAVIEGWITAAAARGEEVAVLWQIVPYVLITIAEVLVSVTGLEFAYTQAPPAMKSTIMGFWMLCVTVGNLLVSFIARRFGGLSLEEFFWTFAGLMTVAAVVFSVLASRYRGRTYIRA